MFRIVAILSLASVWFGLNFSNIAASQSDPASCTVEPRSEAELIALNSTPTAPVDITPVALPAGVPVSDDEMVAINDLLAQIDACTAAGDIARLLALYSDEYVATVALAGEPVPIVPGPSGTPTGTLPEGTPAPVTVPIVQRAVTIAEGRIAAVVTDGDEDSEIYFLVEEDGVLRVDAIAPIATKPIATPAPEHPAGVDAALTQAATDLGVPIESIEIVSAEATEWMDSSLGCPKVGELYAQVLTPGFLVTIQSGDTVRVYHTDESGTAVFCEP